MHELGLATELKNLIEEKRENQPVKGVEIEVGLLSGADRHSFDFCTQAVLQASFGKELKINITYIKAEARCHCGHQYDIKDILMPCPSCKKYERDIISGTDIRLKSIEIED